MSRARLVLAEDHVDMANDLCHLLSTMFDVIAIVHRGEALIVAADSLLPDAIVTDITMPGVDGIAAVQDIRPRHPTMGVIIVTVHDDRALVRRAFDCGARGYVLKASAGDDLIRAVEAVLAGGQFVSANLADALNKNVEFARH